MSSCQSTQEHLRTQVRKGLFFLGAYMRHVCDRTELARVACEDNRVTCKVTRVALKPLLNLGLRVLRANACELTTTRVHVYEEDANLFAIRGLTYRTL